MLFTVYILYSQKLDKFYIGYTSGSLEDRIKKHLSDHTGFTSTAKDWELAYSELVDTKSAAIKREKEIKQWKSKQRVKALIANRK